MPTDDIKGFFEQQEAEAERRKALKIEDEKTDADIRSVMASEQGRRVIAWILDLTGLDESISSCDAMNMALLSGRRDVGLSIVKRLFRACPSNYEQLLRERRNG